MSRRNPTTTFAVLLVAAAGLPLVPVPGVVQTVVAAVFLPVSHPAKLGGDVAAGWFGDDASTDPESPDAPRELAAIARENQSLRQQLERLYVQLESLKQLNADRAALGTDLRDRMVPAAVVARVDGEADVLQIAAAGGLKAGQAAVGVVDGHVAAVGRVISTAGPIGRVRLTTDQQMRPFGARFVRFDETAGTLLSLPTEPFVIVGTGGGLSIARHRTADLEAAGVVTGIVAVLDDADWPALLAGMRVGRVAAVEALPREPGFSRVVLSTVIDADALREVMVLTDESLR